MGVRVLKLARRLELEGQTFSSVCGLMRGLVRLELGPGGYSER
jgi:hypothetical protein